MLMAIFDKSFIHGITTDEAAVFDVHFMSNITPLFFVEVLADLEKADMADEAQRTALVRRLAAKTPVYHSYPNVPHPELLFHELLGYEIELSGRPIVGGGRRVQTPDGLGTVFDEPSEMKALSRWHSGVFAEEEYASARLWRDMLEESPGATAQLAGGTATRFAFRDLAAIKKLTDKLIDADGMRFKILKGTLESLKIPYQFHAGVIARWKAADGPRLRDFAPYTAHVLSVDLFRILGMASGHIDPDKTSNYADMAYLYYVPFCEVFISTDKLHRRCAPLFLRENQQFVWGLELRKHLAQLVAEYSAAPDLEEKGLPNVAARKVFEKDSVIGRLYEHLGRNRISAPSRELRTPEDEKKLVDRLKSYNQAPPPDAAADLQVDDHMMSMSRNIPLYRGRFAMFASHVRDSITDGGERSQPP